MKICIIGDFTEPRDTGERNLAYNLARFLSQRHSVMTMRPKELFSWKVFRHLWKFRPDIVHYVTGPRTRSFVILWLLKQISRCNVSIMSAPRPVVPKTHLRWLRFIRPSLVLSQSQAHTQIFRSHGFNTEFLPNGIDGEKFHPVGAPRKRQLRDKYRIPQDKFVVLHVGYIAPRRGIQTLIKIARIQDVHVILVGATSWIEPDETLVKGLKTAGCTLFLKYLPNIEEMYQVSDCFVFPGMGQLAKDGAGFDGPNQSPSIEIPLSVLEALSCGIPVVARKFGGLADMFRGGIHFAANEEDIIKQVIRIKSVDGSTPLPDMTSYTWEGIVARLEQIYSVLLERV